MSGGKTDAFGGTGDEDAFSDEVGLEGGDVGIGAAVDRIGDVVAWVAFSIRMGIRGLEIL